MTNSVLLKTLALSHLREQPPVSNRCHCSKVRAFRCLPTWKSRRKSNNLSQIMIGSSGSRPREYYSWTGGVEAPQWTTPSPNRCLQNTQTQTWLESEPGIKESPDIRALDEFIERRIEEAKLQIHSQSILLATKVSDSPFWRNLECQFLRKFSTSTFNYYSRMSDPIQHIRH